MKLQVTAVTLQSHNAIYGQVKHSTQFTPREALIEILSSDKLQLMQLSQKEILRL